MEVINTMGEGEVMYIDIIEPIHIRAIRWLLVEIMYHIHYVQLDTHVEHWHQLMVIIRGKQSYIISLGSK